MSLDAGLAEHELLRLAGRVLLAGTEAQASDVGIVARLSESDQTRIFDHLRRGKVPLFGTRSQDRSRPSELLFSALDTPGLTDAVERERQRCDDQRLGFLTAQDALAEAGIPLLLFKTTGPYPYTSSNVDALVPKGELERATSVLESHGHHEMTHYWEPNKRLLRKFEQNRVRVMMHLHEQISWIVLTFSDLEALWREARSASDPTVLHPAPEHVAAALLAHAVYESNRVSIGDVWKVRSALSEPGFDWDEVVRIARQRHWLPGLAFSRAWYAGVEKQLFGHSLLDDAPIVATLQPLADRPRERLRALHASARLPASLRNRDTKPFFFRKLWLDNERRPLERVWDTIGLFHQIAWGRLRLRRRPTSFIGLCGIDGSGKSTQAEAVRAALETCELPTSEVWMRSGYSPVVEGLKRVARSASAQVPDTDDEAGKVAVYRSSRWRTAWTWLVTIEQIAQAFLQVTVPRWLGRFPVAERYVPDTLADLAERFDDPDFPSSGAGRVLRALTPAPDLILSLDLSGESAFRRKSDAWSPEILEQRRGLYREALSHYRNVVALDAERPLEELRDEVVDHALRTVLGRMRRHNFLNRQRRDAWE